MSVITEVYRSCRLRKRYSRKLRIENYIDQQLGEYQAGFRKGRSGAEQIFIIKTMIKTTALAADKKVIMMFVDFKKAYDSVDRDTLIKVRRNLESTMRRDHSYRKHKQTPDHKSYS